MNRNLKYYSSEKFKSAFSNAFPPDIKKWFFQENLKRYEIIVDIDPNKPQVSYDPPVLNLGKTFKHQKKKYSTYPESIKRNVQFYLDFLKVVFCDNSEALLNYLLRWLAVAASGKKNETIIYIKTVLEGVGKSKLIKFLLHHVFGPDLCIESDEQPLTTNFNGILMGKLLVVFDELEVFHKDWGMANSRLRRWATSDIGIYTNKGENQIHAQNKNNYIVISNVDVLKMGRRVVNLVINTKYWQNHDYFQKLTDMCLNDEVGEAFFNYLLTIDVSKFHSERDMPVSSQKLNALADAIPNEFKFIKEEYVLKTKDLKSSVKDLFEEFQTFCLSNNIKAYGRNEFINKLREVGIIFHKSDGYNIYKLSMNDLRKIANKYHWIHE